MNFSLFFIFLFFFVLFVVFRCLQTIQYFHSTPPSFYSRRNAKGKCCVVYAYNTTCCRLHVNAVNNIIRYCLLPFQGGFHWRTLCLAAANASTHLCIFWVKFVRRRAMRTIYEQHVLSVRCFHTSAWFVKTHGSSVPLKTSIRTDVF